MPLQTKLTQKLRNEDRVAMSAVPGFRNSTVALAWLAVAACSPSLDLVLPDTEVVYEGEQVRIHSARDGSVCAGTGVAMEQMLAYLGRETGLGDITAPVDVYFLDLEDVTEACGSDAFACAFFGDERPFVLTSYVPTEHELVHSFFTLKQDKPRSRHSFFEEGFASVYGRDGVLPSPTTGLEDAMSYASQLPVEHYPRAAHFVDFIVNEFGPEATAQFVLATAADGANTRDGLENVFLSSFGVSLQTVVDLYEAQAPVCSSIGWQRGYDCEESPADWDVSGSIRFNVGNSCSDPSVLGAADDLVRERFVVAFSDPSTLSIQLDSAVQQHYPRVRLVKCGSCDDEFVLDYDLSNGPLFGSEIDPGKYVLTTYFPDGLSEQAVLKLRHE